MTWPESNIFETHAGVDRAGFTGLNPYRVNVFVVTDTDVGDIDFVGYLYEN